MAPPICKVSCASFTASIPTPYRKYLYEYRERDAVRHVFRVASSLDSMVVGEPQILGQVKEAYATARAVGAVNSQLDALLTRAFAVAKRVRNETAVATSAVSVASVAVDLAKKIFGNLQGKSVYLVGAGKMCELAARHLLAHGAKQIYVANRTYERAAALAKKFNGEAIPFEQLYETVPSADIVISSTGAPHAIFRKEHGEKFLSQRRNRPMFFIDIAVPRDIDPEMNKLDGIFVYDIDDLQQVVSSHVADRQRRSRPRRSHRAAGGGQVPGAAANARCGADHRLAAGAPGDRAPGRDRPRARPAGNAHARAGTGGRSADPRHHQQDHAHTHHHAEERGPRIVGGHDRDRSGAQAVRPARCQATPPRRRCNHRGQRKTGSAKLMARLRIGSRGSQLALWQANHISALLRERGHEVELEIIKTTGDKITDVALAQVGTKGMFTKEIEEALAEGRVDLAVHSLKDLPTELPPGFELVAITTRVNPRDVFLSVKYDSVRALPKGARVGTSSLRRQAQLKVARPDLVIHPLRGNVDTRVRKLEEGEYDAIILAAAGLTRLGKTQLVKEVSVGRVHVSRGRAGRAGHRDSRRRRGDARASGVSRRRCGPRRHDLRARVAEQAGRRMPGADRRVRRDEGWQAAADRDCRAARMDRRFCANSRAAAIRWRLAKRWATRCCIAARPGFWKRFMAWRQRRRNSRRSSCQLPVVSCQCSQSDALACVILSGGGAGFATPESKDLYFGKQSPHKHCTERLAAGRMPRSGVAREEAGGRAVFGAARTGLRGHRNSLHRDSQAQFLPAAGYSVAKSCNLRLADSHQREWRGGAVRAHGEEEDRCRRRWRI